MDWRLLTKVGVGGFMNFFTCEKELSSILVVLRTLHCLMPAFVVAAAASAINRTKLGFRTCSGQKLNLNQSWLFLIPKKEVRIYLLAQGV